MTDRRVLSLYAAWTMFVVMAWCIAAVVVAPWVLA